MTLWFSQRDRKTGQILRRNLDREPSPTISARCDYVGNVLNESYYLEADDSLMARYLQITDPAASRGRRSTSKPLPSNDDRKRFVRDQTKPEYRIPSMAEVIALPPNGYKVISTFAGCGGSSLGYRMAGFEILWANEFVDAAREVYAANSPDAIVDGRDIREVDPLAVLKLLKMKPGDLDVLDGSPPCASFSSAGKRAADWGKTKKYSDRSQRTDDLFFEFIRFVKVMQPKVFVAENVSGLVKGVAKGYFLQILAAMKACGYRVEAKLLDAQWLGVPQARQRIIFVGVREDLGVAPAHPEPLPYRYSVRDALPWISGVQFSTGGQNQAKDSNRSVDEPAHSITAGAKNATHHTVMIGANGGFGKEQWQSVNEPAKTIGTSPKTGNGRVGAGDLFIVESESDMGPYAVGREWDALPPGGSTYYGGRLYKPDADNPSPTVTARGGDASVASVAHPTEKRKFSIAELKRICAFPDDFVLTGTYGQKWERLGRAVPPVMMRAIAETVRDRILRPLSRGAQSDLPSSRSRRRRDTAASRPPP